MGCFTGLFIFAVDLSYIQPQLLASFVEESLGGDESTKMANFSLVTPGPASWKRISEEDASPKDGPALSTRRIPSPNENKARAMNEPVTTRQQAGTAHTCEMIETIMFPLDRMGRALTAEAGAPTTFMDTVLCWLEDRDRVQIL
jgi:hypothetical protein